MNAHLSLSSNVVLTPRRAGLSTGQDNTIEVLARIQAPEAPTGHGAQRPPQALALVIDRSGSMAGRPLEEAKRCAEYVLGKLRPTDALVLVKFDNRVQRLWPAVALGDGTPQRAAIAGIHGGGNTNLHGGWAEGAEALVDIAGQGLKRVILLSDGQAGVRVSPELIFWRAFEQLYLSEEPEDVIHDGLIAALEVIDASWTEDTLGTLHRARR